MVLFSSYRRFLITFTINLDSEDFDKLIFWRFLDSISKDTNMFFVIFFAKSLLYYIYPQSMKKRKGHFWYSVPPIPSHSIKREWFSKLRHVRVFKKWTFRPENKKVTYLWWFCKFWPPPPTWHQILTHKNVGGNFLLQV